MLSVFYLLSFLLFVVTIATHQKYRIFDPFLQISPVLSTELYTPKAVNEIRILLLGGSTTRNSNVAENKRYDFLLQYKLSEKYPNRKISVFNAGMDWFTSRHSLIAYVNYYQYYHADLVLIMHTINDVVRSFTPLDYAQNFFKYDYSHFYGPAAYAAFPERTYPERLINKLKHFINKKILNKKDFYMDFDTSSYKSIKSYEYFMGALINSIEKNNSKVILLSEASIYNNNLSDKEKSSLWFAEAFCYHQADNNYNKLGRYIASVKSLENALKYFNNKAAQISSEKNIPFIDLASYIPKNSDYFIDDVHFTEKGADLAASVVVEFIIKNDSSSLFRGDK